MGNNNKMEVDTITVCGGGNAAHTVIPVLRQKFSGKINLYLPFQSEINQFNRLIVGDDKIVAYFGNKTFSGSPSKESNLPEEV